MSEINQYEDRKYMNFNFSEIMTIKRAFIIYNKQMPYGLRGKGFFIDATTCKKDIMNMIDIERKLGIY